VLIYEESSATKNVPSKENLNEYIRHMKHLKSFGNLFGAKRIDESRMDPLGNPYKTLDNAFKKSQWNPAFTALGFRLPSMQMDQLIFEPDNNMRSGGPYQQLIEFMDPVPENPGIGEYPTINIPQFCVDPRTSAFLNASYFEKKGFKVKSRFYSDENPPMVWVEGRTETAKEMEDFVMDRYIKALKKTSIKGFPPGKHPILRMMLDAFSGKLPLHVPTYFAEAVNQDPKSISRVPAAYLPEVSRLTGISAEEIHSIRAAEDFGII